MDRSKVRIARLLETAPAARLFRISALYLALITSALVGISAEVGAATISAVTLDKRTGTWTGVPAWNLQILRQGFNMFNTFGGDTNNFRPTDAYLAQLRAAGVTHIRLPVMSDFAIVGCPINAKNGVADVNRVASTMKRLDSFIQQANAAKLGVIIDFHPNPGLRELQKSARAADRELARNMVVQFWEETSRRYARTNPSKVFFELMNEPAVSIDEWNTLSDQLVQVVRRNAPRHTLIIGPQGGYNVNNLKYLRVKADKNIIYAVHMYEPAAFVFQGDPNIGSGMFRQYVGLQFPTTWRKNAGIPNNRYGVEYTANTIANYLRPAYDFSVANGVPVMVNEFGVQVLADKQSRINWIKAVTEVTNMYGFGRTYWSLHDRSLTVEDKDGNIDKDLAGAMNLRF